MKPRRGEATTVIDAPPARVFAAIPEAVGAPPQLVEGTEWPAGPKRRAHVIEFDPADRRLAYRSKRDEENPSFAVWTWQVDPAADGSRITLAWELRPVTFLRKRVFSVVRNRRIARTEAPALLDAVRRRATSSSLAAGAGST